MNQCLVDQTFETVSPYEQISPTWFECVRPKTMFDVQLQIWIHFDMFKQK